jgi:hypothetical protein
VIVRAVACAAVAAALAACAALEPACGPGEAAAVSDVLHFGTARPGGGEVSAVEWDEFLRDVVTPRFPEGLTVWRASGQWRSQRGTIVREPSYVLAIVHPRNARTDAAIAAIVREYKARFAQDAVLRVESGSCISY